MSKKLAKKVARRFFLASNYPEWLSSLLRELERDFPDTQIDVNEREGKIVFLYDPEVLGDHTKDTRRWMEQAKKEIQNKLEDVHGNPNIKSVQVRPSIEEDLVEVFINLVAKDLNKPHAVSNVLAMARESVGSMKENLIRAKEVKPGWRLWKHNELFQLGYDPTKDQWYAVAVFGQEPEFVKIDSREAVKIAKKGFDSSLIQNFFE